MITGVVLSYSENLARDFQWCAENGIPSCQLSTPPELETEETAKIIDSARTAHGMTITALVGTWSGPNEWNFTAGPATLGIVPRAYRAMRLQELERCAKFAHRLGVSDMCTHMGFIPENPADPLYTETVPAIRHLAAICKGLGLRLNMETGQETPATLLRTISDVGADNLGLNFDPANLLMYGKANPIDALSVVGPYINGVHAKDGLYPVDGVNLGQEMPLGEGAVQIEAFVRKLIEIGYDGALTIEREISGEQQRQDVLAANRLLLAILDKLGGRLA